MPTKAPETPELAEVIDLFKTFIAANPAAMPEWITEKEAVQISRTSQSTIRRWRLAGLVRSKKIGPKPPKGRIRDNRPRRYNRDDVLAQMHDDNGQVAA